MTLESDLARIEAALDAVMRAEEARGHDMSSQHLSNAVHEASLQLMVACRPNLIRRLIRIARAADCLADELDNLMNILVPAARKALAAYRAMKEQQP